MKKLLSGKLHILSLGCSKNLIDSEVMGRLARASGMTMAERPQDADVVLINTCGFIGPAKEESLEAILTLAQIKKQRGRDLKLVVAGCLAQRYGKALSSEIPEADCGSAREKSDALPNICEGSTQAGPGGRRLSPSRIF